MDSKSFGIRFIPNVSLADICIKCTLFTLNKKYTLFQNTLNSFTKYFNLMKEIT